QLLKTFKRLGELRMTVEILVETGVGKTVNSFRRHEVVGEAAKRLVVQWKRLVPRSADSNEEEEEQGYHTNYSSSPPQQEQYSPSQQRGYHSDEYECLKPEPSHPPHKNVRHAKSNRESGKKHHQSHQRGDRNRQNRTRSPPHTNSQPSQSASAPPKSAPQAIQPNYKPLPSIDFKPLSPQKRKVKVCTYRDRKGRSGGGPAEGRGKKLSDSPVSFRLKSDQDGKDQDLSTSEGQHKLDVFGDKSERLVFFSVPSQRGELPGDWSRKNLEETGPSISGQVSLVFFVIYPNNDKNVRHAKSNRESGKKHHQSHQRGDRNEEPHQHGAKVGGHRGGVEGKQPSLESPVQKSSKQNKESTAHKRKMEENKKEEAKEETSTMSFESFLTYDAPTSVKKKNQPSQSASAPPKSAPQAKKARGTKRSHSGSNSVEATEEKRSRLLKRCRISPCHHRHQVVEAVPVLPEIPLPAIQPNYKPLPSIDFKPLSPQKRKESVPVCNEEEDAGFTGKRLNSKMVVFSGSKTSYLPRMMTLQEQCIRVLQNNIDSIGEVGGVPFDILEPVLERCTPEQLYRIEQSNQWFIEDSDELWMRHCQREFKRETPQEYESWRELYLRLHDEREERLKLLTHNISTAHANKPKARQVKMAFVDSVAKPPRDVRRRQEKFGTAGGLSTAASTKAASPVKRVPTTDNSGELSRPTSSQQNHSTHSSSRSTPAGGAVLAKDKPQVKKIGPMMAKTIKAFKNRFSRR
uniref:Elongin A n=2 Tax=Tetraodon nigroviridis TaxID=99883 RepID=H3D190_TETNG